MSRQDSTRFSPFYLVYGRNAHLPIEFNARDSDSEEDEESPLGLKDTTLDERTERMILFRKKALENIGREQERQKQHYDGKHSQNKANYKVGALVLLKNARKLTRKGARLQPNWTGPYKISEVVGKGTVRLCD